MPSRASSASRSWRQFVPMACGVRRRSSRLEAGARSDSGAHIGPTLGPTPARTYTRSEGGSAGQASEPAHACPATLGSARRRSVAYHLHDIALAPWRARCAKPSGSMCGRRTAAHERATLGVVRLASGAPPRSSEGWGAGSLKAWLRHGPSGFGLGRLLACIGIVLAA